VLLSYTDSAAAHEVKGDVHRRGLCGDVFLTGMPAAARSGEVKVDTSVRNGEISVSTELFDLAPGEQYVLRAQIKDGAQSVKKFASKAFSRDDLKTGDSLSPKNGSRRNSGTSTPRKINTR